MKWTCFLKNTPTITNTRWNYFYVYSYDPFQIKLYKWCGVELSKIALPMRKASDWHGFTGEFYHTFKEEIMPSLSKLFQKMRRELFFILEGQYNPDIKKWTGTLAEKTLQINVPHEHRCKIPYQNIFQLNSAIYKMASPS